MMAYIAKVASEIVPALRSATFKVYARLDGVDFTSGGIAAFVWVMTFRC